MLIYILLNKIYQLLRRFYIKDVFGANPPKVHVDNFITSLRRTQRFFEAWKQKSQNNRNVFRGGRRGNTFIKSEKHIPVLW